MKHSLPFAAALLAAFSLTAAAEDYDLRKLVERKFEAGSKYSETTIEESAQKQTVSQGGQVLQEQNNTKASTQDRLVEVLSTGDEGKPTKIRYTYKSMTTTEAGEEKSVEVEGLIVTVDMTGEVAKIEAEGGKEIPAPLLAKLEAGAKKNMSDKKKEGPEALLPEKPVAIGAEWTKEPTEALKSMGIPGEGLIKDKSSVKCKLEQGKNGLLKITMTLRFAFSSFQGMTVDGDPMTITLDVVLCIAPKGMPLGSMQNAMVMVGKLSGPGANIDMSIKQSGLSVRSAAK